MVSFMFSALIVIAFVVVIAKIAAIALRPMLLIGAIALVARGLQLIGIDPAVAVGVLVLALFARLLMVWAKRDGGAVSEPAALASGPGLAAPVRCPACGGGNRDECARCGGAGWVDTTAG
jgi:hypothetical protein